MHKYVNIYIKYAYICISIHETFININKSAIFEYQTSQGPSDKPTRQDCTVTSPDNPEYHRLYLANLLYCDAVIDPPWDIIKEIIGK